MESKLNTLQAVTSMLQELLAPLITLMSSYELLKDKIPPEITPALNVIDEAGGRLKNEVHYLYLNVEKEFDLSSPANAALQIRQHVIQWEKHKTALSHALQQIHGLKEAGFKSNDSEMDLILGEVMSNAFNKFEQLLNNVRIIEGKDLIPPKPANKIR